MSRNALRPISRVAAAPGAPQFGCSAPPAPRASGPASLKARLTGARVARRATDDPVLMVILGLSCVVNAVGAVWFRIRRTTSRTRRGCRSRVICCLRGREISGTLLRMDDAEYSALMQLLRGDTRAWTELDDDTMKVRLQQVRELQGNPKFDEDTLILLETFHDEVSGEVSRRREPGPPRARERPAPEYVGISEEAARQLAQDRGRPLRVVGRNGVGFPVTADLVYGRIDAWVEGGIVIRADETYDPVTGTIHLKRNGLRGSGTDC